MFFLQVLHITSKGPWPLRLSRLTSPRLNRDKNAVNYEFEHAGSR